MNWKQPFLWTSVYWNEVARQNTDKLLVVHNASGSHQLHSFDVKTGHAVQLTDEKGGKAFGSIASKGDWIFYLDDEHGNEIGHFVRVPFGGGMKEDISPNLPPYSSFFVRTNADSSLYVWTAAMNESHSVFCIDIYAEDKMSDPKCVYHSQNFVDTPIVSASGRYICIHEEEANGADIRHTMKMIDRREGTFFTVSGLPQYQDVQPISFLGDEEEVVIATYRKGDFRQPILVNILTRETTEFGLDMLIGDMNPLFYDAKKHQILFSCEYEARQRLYIYSINHKAMEEVSTGSGSFLSWFASAHLRPEGGVLIQWEDAGHPACLAVADSLQSSGIPAVLHPKIDKNVNVRWEEVHFQSDSRNTIQAWMMRPNQQGAVPFIISAHGGPHSVSLDVFTPEALMWVEAGFGYMAVNYSGSTSFGEKFKESIRGKPGKLEAIDMVAARNFLVDQGIANESKIILTGWSWGGFITLLTLGLYPKLWAAGIAGIPVADTIASYEDETASMKTLDHELFGGAPSEVGEAYTSSSPISYVQDIDAPILIIHAKNDSRCPARQVENFVSKMKEEGKLIKTHWFDSGHLGHFSDPQVAISNYEVALQFAHEHAKNQT